MAPTRSAPASSALVKLLGEASIGSGVRRVEALVGTDAYDFLAREHAVVGQLTEALKVRPEELPERVASILGRLKDAEREIADDAPAAGARPQAGALVSGARDVFGVSFIGHDAGTGVARRRPARARRSTCAAGSATTGPASSRWPAWPRTGRVVIVATNERGPAVGRPGR